MSLFENIKLKLKKKSPVIEKLETSSNVLKECKDIKVTGNRSVAFGDNDFPIPTGICANPVSKELREIIMHDTVGQLLHNPFNNCIFYNVSTGYCFFAGLCNEKQEISNAQIESYKEQMKLQIHSEENK